jgi:isocitrate/isopropylmalate dehydrogenase
MSDDGVRLPGSAVDPAGTDIAEPTAELLRSVLLLPTKES